MVLSLLNLVASPQDLIVWLETFLSRDLIVDPGLIDFEVMMGGKILIVIEPFVEILDDHLVLFQWWKA